jgi:hypothetical protein
VWLIVLAVSSRRIIDMQIRSVGIDHGKTTFHLVALGHSGKVLLKKKFTQKQLITFTANQLMPNNSERITPFNSESDRWARFEISRGKKEPEKVERLPTVLENEEVRHSSAPVTTVQIHPPQRTAPLPEAITIPKRASALGTVPV